MRKIFHTYEAAVDRLQRFKDQVQPDAATFVQIHSQRRHDGTLAEEYVRIAIVYGSDLNGGSRCADARIGEDGDIDAALVKLTKDKARADAKAAIDAANDNIVASGAEEGVEG